MLIEEPSPGALNAQLLHSQIIAALGRTVPLRTLHGRETTTIRVGALSATEEAALRNVVRNHDGTAANATEAAAEVSAAIVAKARAGRRAELKAKLGSGPLADGELMELLRLAL